ncbi:MAG: hypothetical protein MJ234_06675 [bacterium]|nr:hypothetical protein [bacterium]
MRTSLLKAVLCAVMIAFIAAVPSFADENPNAFFFLLLPPEDGGSLYVESVTLVDASDRPVCVYYPGRPEASKGASVPSGTGCWGTPSKDESSGIFSVNVNEKKGKAPYSAVLFDMPRPCESGDAVIVRYRDDNGALSPVAVIKGSAFKRLGQIYRSGSGRWAEDIFELPAVMEK